MKKSNMKSKIKCDTKKLNNKQVNRSASGITLIALIITIVLNSCRCGRKEICIT